LSSMLNQEKMRDPLYIGRIFGCKFIDLNDYINTETVLLNMVRNKNYKIRVEVPKRILGLTDLTNDMFPGSSMDDISDMEVAKSIKMLFNNALKEKYPHDTNEIKILYKTMDLEYDTANVLKNIMDMNGDKY